jgi:uncharacterized protein YqeY
MRAYQPGSRQDKTMEENKPGPAALKIKLSEDVKNSMRAGDKTRTSVLRLLLSAINNAFIARQAELNEADIFVVIAKEIKQRQESIEAFKLGNRNDLVVKEEAELAILKEYLPQQLTRDEIMVLAKKIVQESGAQGPRDKGKVMPKLMAEVKGKADGRIVNEVVTELLGK